MRLFLEPTSKAIAQVGTTGVETKHEDREVEEHEDSYARRPVGAASGEEAGPDDPKVGKQWRGDGESQGDAVRTQREGRKSRDEKDGLIAKKSLNEACDLLKSMTNEMEDSIRASMPDAIEIDFLVNVLERDRGEVLKGIHWISGTDRDLFNDWVCDRMSKSIDALIRRVP